MQKYAIFSLTSDDSLKPDHVKERPYYSFFAPLAAYLWNRIGYKSIVFAVGNTELNPVVLEELHKNEAITIGINSIPGYRDSTVAQFSRMFGALYRGLNQDDYCLTSDVDVLPFDGDYFNNLPSQDFHLWSADHYHDNPDKMTRVPMCFNGGAVKIWKEIFGQNDMMFHLIKGLTSLNQNSDHWSAWFHDETYLVAQLRKWSGFPNRCALMTRGTVTEMNDVMAARRIDRAHWHEDMSNPIDSHSLRPGHCGANWESLLRIFNRVLDKDSIEYIQQYRERFVQSV